MDQLTWRKGATAEDELLLLALFAESRAGDFAPLGWSDEQLRPLLEMQFRARQTGYAQSYPAATDMILCRQDGTPVGRLLLALQNGSYRIVDIAVLASRRKHGIATWALQQIQQAAAVEQLPVRLRVQKNNSALALYEHLGFMRVAGDELSYEMEWRPARSAQSNATCELPAAIETAHGVEFERSDVIDRIAAFLGEIGLDVHFGPVSSNSFLPGIQVERNGLRVDVETLKYPGDLLHEAGHLAVMAPAQRNEEFPGSNEPAEEMAALAWSYAAALHIGIAPEIVFHENGYRGQSATLLQGYRQGKLNGQPILWWHGMTTPELPGCPSIYPKMLRWLREDAGQQQEADAAAAAAGVL